MLNKTPDKPGCPVYMFSIVLLCSTWSSSQFMGGNAPSPCVMMNGGKWWQCNVLDMQAHATHMHMRWPPETYASYLFESFAALVQMFAAVLHTCSTLASAVV